MLTICLKQGNNFSLWKLNLKHMTVIIHIFHKTLACSCGPWFHKGGTILVWFPGLFIYSSLSDLFCLLLHFIKLPRQMKMSWWSVLECVCSKKPSKIPGLQSWHPPLQAFIHWNPYIFISLICHSSPHLYIWDEHGWSFGKTEQLKGPALWAYGKKDLPKAGQ